MRFSRPLKILVASLFVGFGCRTLAIAVAPQTTTARLPKSEVLSQQLDLHAAEGLVYFRGQPFTGRETAVYPSGALSERTNYLGGKKHGLREQWYPDGKPRLRIRYKEGRYDGESLAWWRDGKPRSQGYYLQGKSEGAYFQWYQSGQLFKQTNFVHGQEQGLQQAWRENGKLYANYEVRNGRIFGLKRADLCYQLEEEKFDK